MSNAKVAIIMGSDSDLPIMSEAGRALDQFSIPYEILVVSAHRTPDFMHEFATSAESKGFSLIIAGAGGAAHLPGMTAGLTILPVIGVPMKTSKLEGLDSLLSIAQMPQGVPVATVSIDGAYNAGLLAARILSLSDNTLKKSVRDDVLQMKQEVLDKSDKLHNLGFKKYLEDLTS